MAEFFTSVFAWPSLPASLLLVLVTVYWLLVMVGAFDFDFLHFDFHHDLHVDVDAPDSSVLDIGFVPLRFLNLGTVPLMLWMSVFALCFWVTTRVIDGSAVYAELGLIAQAVFRNAGIALIATKLLTQPLRGRFTPKEPHCAVDLIGKLCVITTAEATEKFGEAQFATDAAPLQLTVRSVDGTLIKGEAAEIVDFAPEQNVYLVKRASLEV